MQFELVELLVKSPLTLTDESGIQNKVFGTHSTLTTLACMECTSLQKYDSAIVCFMLLSDRHNVTKLIIETEGHGCLF